MLSEASITVVIAAFEAAATVGRAVRSALAEPEVGEVIVVDDCSGDRTAEAAREVAGSDHRLRLVRQDKNQGPSAARNRAIAESSLPFIAILDADDAFLPGRFSVLMQDADKWDFCADNVHFVARDGGSPPCAAVSAATGERCMLSLSAFVQGNISRRGRLRGELGFLKPVFRKSFAQKIALSYAPECWLGEDYLFYAEAIARGARYCLYKQCGYLAWHRDNSLSAAHRTEDLRALEGRCRGLRNRLDLTAEEDELMLAHLRSIQAKVQHREVLDARARHGLAAGLVALAKRPRALPSVLLDRLPKFAANGREGRKLVSDQAFEALCG